LRIDTLIKGGEIVDGSGGPSFCGDVGIKDDKIVHVGKELFADNAACVIDARDLIVTPGLIDPHSHTDWSILSNPHALSTTHQGVTTEIVGNCGVTFAPIGEGKTDEMSAALSGYGYHASPAWRSFGELTEYVHSDIKTTPNLAWFVGHTALKNAARANSSYSYDDGLERLVRESFDSGAIGFSTGLEYGSGRFSRTDELIRLAEISREYEGIYASHIRNRDSELAIAVDEFFEIAQRAGRGQLSHLNVRYDTGAPKDAWRNAVERLVSERQQGLDVLADMTPFREGIGLAVGLLPNDIATLPTKQIARALRDSSTRNRVRDDSDRYWRFVHKGQWERVRLGVSPHTPEWEGLPFPQIAEQSGKSEWDCFFDILCAAGEHIESVQLLGTLFTEEHLAEAIGHDHFLLGVDAFSTRRDSALATRTNHPLFYHGHTHYFSHHIFRKGTLDLIEGVHKMTGGVAQHFGLSRRGLLKEGCFADVAVFSPSKLQNTNTFEVPANYAEEARFVWVNGELVVNAGVHTKKKPGRYLPRS